MAGELFEAASAEVADLHAAFARWFRGEEQSFDSIAQAFAADFSMTTPDGRQIAEPLVSEGLRRAKGSRGADFRIWIERIRPVVETPEIVAVIYDECQHADGQDTRRHVTALFRRASAAPLGVRWLRVHETWVDGPLPSRQKAR